MAHKNTHIGTFAISYAGSIRVHRIKYRFITLKLVSLPYSTTTVFYSYQDLPDLAISFKMVRE